MIRKYRYVFLIIICLILFGCSKKTTSEQKEYHKIEFKSILNDGINMDHYMDVSITGVSINGDYDKHGLGYSEGTKLKPYISNDKLKYFFGWYDENGKIISKDFEHWFIVGKNDVTYFAKFYNYCHVSISNYSLSDNEPIDIGDLSRVEYNKEGDYTTNKDSITLIANINNNYYYSFSGWFLEGKFVSNEEKYTFPVPPKNELNIEARWTINSYDIVLSKNISEAGTVSGEGTFEYKSSVTIIATANEGYVFSGWYNGDTRVSTSATYTFTMPYNDLTYEARYEFNNYNLTLTKNIDEAGTVNGAGSKAYKSEVIITAETNQGYTFVGWYDVVGNDFISELTSNMSYTFTMPNENVTYEAVWTCYTITTTKNNVSAGTVTYYDDTKVTAGTEVTITATTNQGYTFDGWYLNNKKVTPNSSYTFNMPNNNVVYEARWIWVTLTTTRNNVSAGTISTYNEKVIQPGTEVTIIATTNTGYTFDGWYNGDNRLATEEEYSFTMPSESVTYTAKWIPLKYTITLDNQVEGLTITGITSGNEYDCGSLITLTVSNIPIMEIFIRLLFLQKT